MNVLVWKPRSDNWVELNRVIGKGYAEKEPRRLEKNITITYNGKTFTFFKDTVLSMAFINTLKSNEEKEAAHQLNRRTDFRILSNDFNPQKVQPQPKQQVSQPKPQTQQPQTQPQPKVNPLPGNTDGSLYTLQLGMGNVNPKVFSKLRGVKKCTDEQGAIIYTLGEFKSEPEAQNANKNVAKSGFKAQVIPFNPSQYSCEDLGAPAPKSQNPPPPGHKQAPKTAPQQTPPPVSNQVEDNSGKRYTIQIGTGNVDKKVFSKLKGVRKCIGSDGIARYIIGDFASKPEAENYNKNITKLGYKGWVTEIDDNRTNCEDL